MLLRVLPEAFDLSVLHFVLQRPEFGSLFQAVISVTSSSQNRS
jgi:hypothetical protein